METYFMYYNLILCVTNISGTVDTWGRKATMGSRVPVPQGARCVLIGSSITCYWVSKMQNMPISTICFYFEFVK